MTMVARDPAGGPRRTASLPVQILGWVVLTALFQFIENLQVTRPGHRVRLGTDFHIYWTAGNLLRHGQNPYQPILGPLGFVYPPWALLPFSALARLHPVPAFELWLALQSAILALLLVLAVCQGMRSWWTLPAAMVIACDGYVYRCSALGQVGVLLLGLVALDFIPRRDFRGRGFLTGLATGIKFTPAIFIVYWLVRRDWRAAGTGAIGFLVSCGAGFLLAPSASRRYWGELVHRHQLGTGVPQQFGNANNQSITNAVQMLWGPSAHHAQMGSLLGLMAAAVAFLGALFAGRLGRPWLSVALLGTASCLVTGSTWDHHYVWSVAAIMSLLTGELSGLWTLAVMTMAWTLWSFPRRWHPLATIPRHSFTATENIEAVATPALAVVFVLAGTLELWRCSRVERPRHPSPLAPSTLQG